MRKKPRITLYHIYDCADQDDLGGILPRRDNSEDLGQGLLIRKAAEITLLEAKVKLDELKLAVEVSIERDYDLSLKCNCLEEVYHALERTSKSGLFNIIIAGNYFRGVYAGLREK